MVLHQEGFEVDGLKPHLKKQTKNKKTKTGILVVLGSKRVMSIPIPNTSIVFFL